MEVEYELTPDDLYHFHWRSSLRSPYAKRAKRKSYLYLVLAFTALSLLPALGAEGFELSHVSLWWLLPLPILFVAFWIIERRLTHRAILELMKEEKPGRGQLGAHKVSLNEAGLIETTAVNESRHSWTGVDRVEHDEKYIYIYTAPHAALMIPRRAFNNLQESESFYQLARINKQSAALASHN